MLFCSSHHALLSLSERAPCHGPNHQRPGPASTLRDRSGAGDSHRIVHSSARPFFLHRSTLPKRRTTPDTWLVVVNGKIETSHFHGALLANIQ
jgi:hypothetical protein